jgi:hypothetical protein
MTPEQIRELALQLYAAVFDSAGAAELSTWQRCLHACRGWDLEPPTAVLISEALTGYVYGESRPQTPLVTSLAKAQAVLHHTTGAADGGAPGSARTRLTPSAIADMVGWVVVTGRNRPESPGQPPVHTRPGGRPA